jgi:hypothetical protein
MKIEFEVEEKYAPVLIDLLEFAAAKAPDTRTFDTIHKIIQELRDDIKNGIEAFQELKKRLAPFTDNSPILLTSDFRSHLGISNVFISSDEGLIKLLNYLLTFLIKLHKPNSTISFIEKTAIDDTNTIDDLVKLILKNYENIH